ncbi:MAG: hypothetical protein JO041_04415 [Acidobacteria bacterium]|nr:hypothetical protein [Acidobacteriota bacterium]
MGAERGVTLLETMMAASVLLVVVAGVAGVFAYAAGQNKGQGEISTRTTEYAGDKMEQLMALSFNDGQTNTTVYPSQSTGGAGLGGTMAASASVGGTNPASPVANYVDYLDASGNVLNSSTGAFYTRLWSIATDSTATLKTITVVVQAAGTGGGAGLKPTTTLVCQKTNYQ